jgi:hypothetical protein
MPTNQLRPTATGARSAQITQPRCKVCQHPQRLDIEVALLEGRSRQLVAERFSTSDRPLNRQNLHVHNQKAHGHGRPRRRRQGARGHETRCSTSTPGAGSKIRKTNCSACYMPMPGQRSWTVGYG